MATSPTLGSQVRVNNDVLFQELQGEAVLLNLKTGFYFGLNQTGTRVWRLLEQHSELAHVLAAMLTEYEVPEERCAQDLIGLVAELEKQGLVTVDSIGHR